MKYSVFKLFLVFPLLINVYIISGQEIQDDHGFFEDEVIKVSNTFHGIRLANSHSIDNLNKRELNVIISHRFGRLSDGAYELWGLDYATIRLGVDYGITNDLSAGFGRSTYQKTFDTYLKYKLLNQTKGEKNIPFSVAVTGGASVNTLKFIFPDSAEFSDRVSYFAQILIAKKINKHFSFQIMPVWVHTGYIPDEFDFPDINSSDDAFSVGLATKVSITKRIALNLECYPYVHSNLDNDIPLSVVFDIETGGHIFQLIFTNSEGIFEKAFITGTKGNWNKGDIFFGFNINRIFYFK